MVSTGHRYCPVLQVSQLIHNVGLTEKKRELLLGTSINLLVTPCPVVIVLHCSVYASLYVEIISMNVPM